MLLISLALAHSPHDIAPFVSVAPDGTVLTALKDLLAASADAHTFTYPYVGGAAPACGWALDAATLVTVAGGSLYATTDGGLSMVAVGPPGVTGCARGDDDLRVAAGGAIWSSDDGLDWALETDVGWDAVDVLTFEGRTFVRDSAGLVYAIDSAGADTATDPVTPLATGSCHAFATDGDRLILAPVDGWLLTSTDGETFIPLVNGPTDAHVVYVHGDTILAATATEAAWASDDAGLTWTLRSENLEELASGSGSPEDGVHYLDITERNGTWYLAAWEGLFSLPAGDTHWHQADLRSAPLVRDLAWLPDDDLLVGVYGGGLYRGDAATSSWDDVSRGVPWLYSRRFWVAGPDWYLLTGLIVLTSGDGGGTWLGAKVSGEEVGEALAVDADYPDDPRVLVSGKDGGVGRVMLATAGEWTWTVTELPDCVRRPSDMVLRGDVAWAGCGNRLYRSTDGGHTWMGTRDLGAEMQCLLWKDELLVGTDGGVYREVDGPDGSMTIEPYAFAGASIQEIAWAPDGALWAATSSGVAKTVAGVDEWLGWPLLDQPQTLAIRHDGAVAVGLFDGVWWTTDNGATWSLACPWDIFDDDEASWWWSGWEKQDDEAAKMLSMHAGPTGAVAEIESEGVQFALDTASNQRVRFSISIDGVPEEVVLPAHQLSARWTGTAEPGLHHLRLEVLEGTLMVDGLERWRTPVPVPPAPTLPPTRSCGCGQQGSAAFLLVPLLLPMVRTRRRRHGAGSARNPPAGG